MAPWHTVKQGEDLLTITKKYGFDHWQVIYEHPKNADLKKKRPNPNLLYPGDRVFVPNKELKQAPSQTARRHTFQLPAPKALLRVVLEDEAGEPYANKAYKLKVGKKTYEGTTDARGLLEHNVPLDTEEGELTVWLGEEENAVEANPTWPLKLGHLDPVEEIAGVQARLNNLGFACGSVDDALNEQTQAALKAFQATEGLEPSGSLDEVTKQKLCEKHDSQT